MQRARILASGSNSVLLERGREFLAANSAGTVLVASSPTAAGDLARSSGPLAGVHRFSLRQLAAELAQPALVSAGLVPLGSLGYEAICTRIASELASANRLAWFGPVARSPGFPRALSRTLADLRLNAVNPLALTGTACLDDLARLLAAYERELATLSLADLAATLALASEAAAAASRLGGLPLLFLDVSPPSEAHRAFLRSLCRDAPGVLALVLDHDQDTLGSWQAILGTAVERIADAGTRALDRARRGLFSAATAENAPLDDSVEVFSAPSEALECIEIARRVRDAAAGGQRFDAMAVLMRDPARYQAPLTEAFRRAGIPLWCTRGASRPDPAGRAFLALLHCAAEGCSASRFAEYLSLGQVPKESATARWQPSGDELLDPSAAPAPDEPAPLDPVEAVRVPARWERLIVDAAVIGGVERWRGRLGGLAGELRIRLAAADKEDAATRAHLERQLVELTELAGFALPLIERLAALPASADWGQWIEQGSALAAAALRHPQRVVAALGALAPMSDAGPAGVREVIAALSERLSLLSVDPPARRYGAVFAGLLEDARGSCFDLVFLPGVVEGRFPARNFEDPLLLDQQREHLARGLPLRRDRVANERVLLRTALACAGRRFLFSYPRMDTVQRRPRVPSFYALEIVRAACGRLPNLHRFEETARAGSTAQLGWPAPVAPAASIDDAEFDLSWLRRFSGERSPADKGAARYLVESERPVVRSMRGRWRRWSARWTTDDGLVSLKTGALAAHGLAHRVYSASALQRFAQCPYQFALHSIAGLRPRETADPLETLDPLTRGSLFHAVQFRFLRGQFAAGLLPVPPGALDDALKALDRALAEESAEYAERLAPAIPALWTRQMELLRADLRGWLQAMVRDSEWEPLHTELAFGLPVDPFEAPHRDPASVAEPAILFESLRLRGAVDSIERNREDDSLRVTDYKTGVAPLRRPEVIGGGSAMQPLLYALAVEQKLGGIVQAARLWYATERGGFKAYSIFTGNTARECLRRALAIIDGYIGASFLPAAPARDACDHCDYRPVCGPYEEIRLPRKRPERLEELVQLRGMP